MDPHTLERRIKQLGPTLAIIERQGPQPRDGCRQAFGIGSAYAVVKTVAALCHLPIHLVTPSVWKRHHGILAADDPKEASRALAIRLFPASAESFSLKKHHGRSDAACSPATAPRSSRRESRMKQSIPIQTGSP